MSVSPTKQKTKEHSICERRISDLEAEVKKHKELLKTVLKLSRHLNEMKNKLVIGFSSNLFNSLLTKPLILNKELIERSAPFTNKLDQVKRELRGFTGLRGFSAVLNTSNPFVKILWIFFFLILFSGCIQNVFENISDYYQYTVITKIEYVDEYPMTLPAVTICLARVSPYFSTNATLEKSLHRCEVGGTFCEANDFFSFEARTSFPTNASINCYVLNGGRNSTGHLSDIHSTRTTGVMSGFILEFLLPKDHFIFYYINDAFVKPTTSEIIKPITTGTINQFILEKSVEAKLEYPFNNCWERKNLPDTPLVRQLSASNITYRQVNCFDLCYEMFVQKYAVKNRISEDEARRNDEVKNYDRVKNCNHLCPQECESSQYKISESVFSSDKLIDISTEEFLEIYMNYLEIYMFFDSLKYTKISQTPKTTLSALVSNLGGSIGLFLELSFLSACRAIEFILCFMFKF